MKIVDMIGFNAAVRICGQGDSDTAVPNFRSIVVDDLGDITLADGDVFVDRSSGEVGIGTVAPDQELHVVTAEFPFIFIEETNGTSNTGIGLLNPGVSDTKLIYLRPGGDVWFGDALDSAPAMTWQDVTNNIGIGTGTPSTTLHVVGNATFDGTFSITSSRDAKRGFSKVEPREVLAEDISLALHTTAIGLGAFCIGVCLVIVSTVYLVRLEKRRTGP